MRSQMCDRSGEINNLIFLRWSSGNKLCMAVSVVCRYAFRLEDNIYAYRIKLIGRCGSRIQIKVSEGGETRGVSYNSEVGGIRSCEKDSINVRRRSSRGCIIQEIDSYRL